MSVSNDEINEDNKRLQNYVITALFLSKSYNGLIEIIHAMKMRWNYHEVNPNTKVTDTIKSKQDEVYQNNMASLDTKQ